MRKFGLGRSVSHAVGRVLKWMYKRKYKGRLSLGKNVLFCHKTRIVLLHGGRLHLSGNNMIYGGIKIDCGGVVRLGEYVNIRLDSWVMASKSIDIGDYVIISNNVVITDNNNHPVNPSDRLKMIVSGWETDYWSWRFAESVPVIISANVWIGQYARITKGVNVGCNSVIAANSIVTKNVPPNSIVAGNPAKVVKEDIDKVVSELIND